MFRVLNISYDIGLTDRLVDALDGIASVVRVDPTADVLRSVLPAVRPDLIVVDLDGGSTAAVFALGLIKAIQEADPSWPVVAAGDERETELVLAAVRAGARDILAQDAEREIVRGRIAAQLDRAARGKAVPSGKLTVIASGQPNDGEGLFAVNLAVAQAMRGNEVLLLDFHLPTSLAGPALDLGLNYTIRDAVHDLPRLDRTLLSTVVGRHAPSGLFVLPLALGGKEAMDMTSAAISSLVKALRGLFGSIVVSLAGLQHSALTAELLRDADDAMLVSSQRFTSVKACRDLLAPLTEALDRLTLVVPEYDPAIALTDIQIRAALGLSRAVRLPRTHASLVNAANKGIPLVIDQPRAPYARAVATLAGVPPKPGLLDGWTVPRLLTRMARAPRQRMA
jgi:pilus assembly protein CpaE